MHLKNAFYNPLSFKRNFKLLPWSLSNGVSVITQLLSFLIVEVVTENPGTDLVTPM